VAFKIDRTKVRTAVKLALADTVAQADLAFKVAIEKPQYEWSGETLRQNGTLVGSPRNIVDSGNLRDSQTATPINDFSWQFEWSEDYAALNHEGGFSTYKGNRYYHNPRPWTCYAIKGDSIAPIRYQNPKAELDIPFYFARQFKLYARSY
jgi:hypothetical protein